MSICIIDSFKVLIIFNFPCCCIVIWVNYFQKHFQCFKREYGGSCWRAKYISGKCHLRWPFSRIYLFFCFFYIFKVILVSIAFFLVYVPLKFVFISTEHSIHLVVLTVVYFFELVPFFVFYSNHTSLSFFNRQFTYDLFLTDFQRICTNLF